MELSLGKCEFEPADDACLSHAGDAMVSCGAQGAAPFSDAGRHAGAEKGDPIAPLGCAVA